MQLQFLYGTTTRLFISSYDVFRRITFCSPVLLSAEVVVRAFRWLSFYMKRISVLEPPSPIIFPS